MELKPGYKRSEVGVIPEDWEVEPLHALADKIMVGIASAATHAYRNEGVVMFRNQNIRSGYLDDSDVLYLDEAYEETYRNKRLKAGDLLTARTGYPGTTCIVPPQYEGAQSFTTLITRPDRGRVDSDYLCCFINSEAGQAYFEQNQIGGGQKNVNAGSLKFLTVPLPPTRVEQEAIAGALGDADAFIASLEQLVAKKHHIKQGVMQELMTGNTRLPGFDDAWKQSSLDAVSTRTAGFWGTSNPDNQHRVAANIIRAGDISPSGGLLATASRYLTEPEFARAKCERDDVVITGSGSVGKVWWCDGREHTAGSNFVRIIRPLSSRMSGAFLSHHLRSEATQVLMAEHITVGVLANLSSSFFREPWLALPPRAEQEAIAAILNDMDKEIASLEAKLAKARNIREGMTQNLLTGRVRLI